MKAHRLFKHAIPLGQGAIKTHPNNTLVPQNLAATALNHTPVFQNKRLAWQQALDTIKDHVTAGRELDLKQLRTGIFAHNPANQSRRNKRLRLGRKGKEFRRFNVIQLLDAKWVTAQHNLIFHRIMKGKGIHAAQLIKPVYAITGIDAKDGFAV